MAAIAVEALEREAALLRAKMRVLKERLKKMEERYGIDSDTFLKKFEAEELGDEEDFFVWWSLLKALKTVQERLKRKYANFAEYVAYVRSVLDRYRDVIVDFALEVFLGHLPGGIY